MLSKIIGLLLLSTACSVQAQVLQPQIEHPVSLKIERSAVQSGPFVSEMWSPAELKNCPVILKHQHNGYFSQAGQWVWADKAPAQPTIRYDIYRVKKAWNIIEAHHIEVEWIGQAIREEQGNRFYIQSARREIRSGDRLKASQTPQNSPVVRSTTLPNATQAPMSVLGTLGVNSRLLSPNQYVLIGFHPGGKPCVGDIKRLYDKDLPADSIAEIQITQVHDKTAVAKIIFVKNYSNIKNIIVK